MALGSVMSYEFHSQCTALVRFNPLSNAESVMADTSFGPTQALVETYATRGAGSIPGEVPHLSVVLPSFRSAGVALASAGRLSRVLGKTPWSWEIIIVDDGGGDFQPDVFSGQANIHLITLESNRGKGAAVREGMLTARGKVRVYTDVDLPYGTDSLLTIADLVLRHSFHLVIGDRTMPSSCYTEAIPLPRRVISAVASAVIGAVVTGGFHDTQCGIKAVRGDVAPALFNMLQIDRFAFDVELIYCALKHRLDIKRVPVRLEQNTTSTVRLVRDSIRAASDVARIKVNQLRGAYRSLNLEQIVRNDFDLARHLAGAEPFVGDPRSLTSVLKSPSGRIED
jgi:dolichyl-phosphate beta-glucosyltransferase